MGNTSVPHHIIFSSQYTLHHSTTLASQVNLILVVLRHFHRRSITRSPLVDNLKDPHAGSFSRGFIIHQLPSRPDTIAFTAPAASSEVLTSGQVLLCDLSFSAPNHLGIRYSGFQLFSFPSRPRIKKGRGIDTPIGGVMQGYRRNAGKWASLVTPADCRGFANYGIGF